MRSSRADNNAREEKFRTTPGLRARAFFFAAVDACYASDPRFVEQCLEVMVGVKWPGVETWTCMLQWIVLHAGNMCVLSYASYVSLHMALQFPGKATTIAALGTTRALVHSARKAKIVIGNQYQFIITLCRHLRNMQEKGLLACQFCRDPADVLAATCVLRDVLVCYDNDDNHAWIWAALADLVPFMDDAGFTVAKGLCDVAVSLGEGTPFWFFELLCLHKVCVRVVCLVFAGSWWLPRQVMCRYLFVLFSLFCLRAGLA